MIVPINLQQGRTRNKISPSSAKIPDEILPIVAGETNNQNNEKLLNKKCESEEI